MTVIHEDKNFFIVDKPSGQLVLPIPKSNEATLRDELLEKYPDLATFDRERAGIVHRLDRDTSGSILVARTKPALRFFQGEFGAHRVKKEYIALVYGNVKNDRGIIAVPLGRAKSGKIIPYPTHKKEREARTRWQVVKRFAAYTLLRVTPETGRMHQIRAHLTALGHPIVGDKIYGNLNQKQRMPGIERLFLHASKLAFYDPNAKWNTFESPLPKELEKFLALLT